MLEAREKGPVEILCKEIEFRFGRHMETVPIFVSFVSVLVEQVADIFRTDQHIFTLPMYDQRVMKPDEDSPKVIAAARDMLSGNDPDAMIASAALVHNLCHELNPEDAYPTNHTIDMLSSCASAIRFGLEKPCRSRHAADAAGHIWKQRYGLRLFDSFTPAWQKDWTRVQLQEAILRLALEA